VAPARPLKHTVGRIVLAVYLLGYLGVLLIGQRAVLPVIVGFVLTVLVGMFTATQSRRLKGTGSAWVPFPLRWSLFLIVPALLGSVYLLSVLAPGSSVPDIAHAGLLMPREHYTLVTRHGVPTEVERWRFVVVGLLFHSLWFGGSAFVAWIVFLSDRPTR
jgi:hypothetical protein